jgi:hypothetical protein
MFSILALAAALLPVLAVAGGIVIFGNPTEPSEGMAQLAVFASILFFTALAYVLSFFLVLGFSIRALSKKRSTVPLVDKVLAIIALVITSSLAVYAIGALVFAALNS